jgi:hypothetical protein
VAGKRRFRAVQALKWVTIPAFIIGKAQIEKATEIALAENVNRLEMHPLDEANLFKRLEDAGMSPKDMAAYFARSVSGIYQRLRLCGLIDEIKALLRDNKLTVAQAALLASLKGDEQQAFCDKFRNASSIGTYYIENFLHALHHYSLAGVAQKRCATCKKRTWHTDATLFPEFDDLSDVCFDSDCYRKAWSQAAAAMIAEQPEKERELTGNYLIRCDKIDELFGKDARAIDLGDAVYALIDSDDYQVGASNPEFWAWDLMDWSGKLDFVSRGLRLIATGDIDDKATPIFVKALEFAGISAPKDKAIADKALCDTYESNNSNLAQRVQDIALDRILAAKGYETPDRNEINDFFLNKIKENSYYKKVFVGYTRKSLSAKTVAKMTAEKMLAILSACEIGSWKMPRLHEVESGGIGDSNPFVKLSGLSLDAFTQLYKDITTELVENAMSAKLATEAAEEEDAKA